MPPRTFSSTQTALAQCCMASVVDWGSGACSRPPTTGSTGRTPGRAFGITIGGSPILNRCRNCCKYSAVLQGSSSCTVQDKVAGVGNSTGWSEGSPAAVAAAHLYCMPCCRHQHQLELSLHLTYCQRLVQPAAIIASC